MFKCTAPRKLTTSPHPIYESDKSCIYHRGDDTIIVRVEKSLYGRGESLKVWFNKVSCTLKKFGFIPSGKDYSALRYNGRFKRLPAARL